MIFCLFVIIYLWEQYHTLPPNCSELISREKREREREIALGRGELISFQLFKNKKECLIPCLRLHTDYADMLSFLFHLWERSIRSQTVLRYAISSSIIALSSHIKTTCKLHRCWGRHWSNSAALECFLAGSPPSHALAAFLFRLCWIWGHERRFHDQWFIIHLGFFEAYCVTSPVLCSVWLSFQGVQSMGEGGRGREGRQLNKGDTK